MTWHQVILLCAALVAGATASLKGQATPADSQAMARRVSAIARLRTGQPIRIRSADGGRRVGPVLGTEGTALLVGAEADGTDPVRIPVAAIDSLWVQGRATGTGTWVGAIVGAVIGGALVAAYCSAAAEGESDCGNSGRYVLAGIGVGALPGALLGAGIGSLVTKWHRRFP